ncbi:TetR family transcriptional regulator [Caballeronia sordidicola]|uniref:Transcriptional regulator, TetR family n=2 Tax=Burkholderiaceae TaxID=119060 RepID=A0A242MGD7_CABSO|nr:TetR family transcriptional regulator [Caballeronia sordidicola]OTP70361.1 Transcriptional regulator, TetR family [Caballeronia sordidicola]
MLRTRLEYEQFVAFTNRVSKGTSMKSRQSPVVSARKRPQQERSTRLVADILEAAVRVLVREGAPRFTAARVAEAAGVSVGSLYQYFPNKEAMLFRLQTEEWARTRALVGGILNDKTHPAPDRLRATVRTFFDTEYEEAAFRTALEDAAPLYRDSPEAQAQKDAAMNIAIAFMDEALPDLGPDRRSLAAEVLITTMSKVGEAVSIKAQSQAEVNRWSAEIADMLCAYIGQLALQPSR